MDPILYAGYNLLEYFTGTVAGAIIGCIDSAYSKNKIFTENAPFLEKFGISAFVTWFTDGVQLLTGSNEDIFVGDMGNMLGFTTGLYLGEKVHKTVSEYRKKQKAQKPELEDVLIESDEIIPEEE